jgi:methionyl-tRNA synthetase
MSSFYLTTPIYYVNDLPHIGHIYTTVVGDVVARYRRLAGDRTYFLTGTDEHGQKIERAAAEKGVAPIELADRVVSRYHELWRELAISHDDFIRTTEPRHAAGVRAVVERIREAGDLYVDRHEGWYCAGCETFYTEKELEGDGRRCPIHGTATEWKSEENVYFRLSAYGDRLLAWYRENPGAVQPESRLNEVRSFVEGGLRDLSVSRAGLAWGIPFPGHEGQTVYVWLDALTNYVSALGFGQGEDELYRTFWEGAETRLHLVGKDILRFHAVYWPAFLMSAGLPLPTTVWAHGWWLRDQKKVSKSTGNVPRLDHLIGRFGGDCLRYFLMREMVFGQDATYSDEGFIERHNSDLANDLGNTVSRLVTLSRRIFGGATPPVACDDNPLVPAARKAAAEYCSAMGELAFQAALQALWRLLAEANGYLVEREPWKRVKDEGASEGLSRVLWNGLEAVRIVAVGLLPFMPRTAPRVLSAIGAGAAPAGLAALDWGRLPTGAELPDPEAIFPRIDKAAYLDEVAGEEIEGLKRPSSVSAGAGGGPPSSVSAGAGGGPPSSASAGAGEGKPGGKMITIDQFFETELRTATVKAAQAIPGSSKLLQLTVDLGGETRTVVAGIAKVYAPEDLVGKQVVVVANLEPAKLMGVESQGMVLAAEADGRPILLHPAEPVPDGSRVR